MYFEIRPNAKPETVICKRTEPTRQPSTIDNSFTKKYYTYSPLFHKLQIWNFTPVDIRIKIGIRLKELRNEKGLSQEKFSFICELDRTYIASIEQGKRNVSIANIEKIAKALDMSVYQFFKSDLFK